jgi:hypothetical protein
MLGFFHLNHQWHLRRRGVAEVFEREDRMKKNTTAAVAVIAILLVATTLLPACSANSGDENKDKVSYPEYTATNNDDLGCVELSYNGIKYRPYGSFTKDSDTDKFKGKQIGVWEETQDRKIYEVKGYDSSDWIVDYLEVTMGGNMIWKAVGVSEIPEELKEFK